MFMGSNSRDFLYYTFKISIDWTAAKIYWFPNEKIIKCIEERYDLG